MKVLSIAVTGVSLALIALTLVPAAGDYRPFLALGALIGAAIVLVTIIVGWRELAAVAIVHPTAEGTSSRVPGAGAPKSTAGPTPTEDRASTGGHATATAPAPPPGPPPGTEVVGFLAVMQEKGRLVDFLQDDITSYSDAQVGAAARVVHQGCKAVLREYFEIVPVREENEGAKVMVAAGYAADEYRLVGKISGQAPFNGTLMHRGWKAEAVTLPRVLRSAGDRFPTIAPAEVELR